MNHYFSLSDLVTISCALRGIPLPKNIGMKTVYADIRDTPPSVYQIGKNQTDHTQATDYKDIKRDFIAGLNSRAYDNWRALSPIAQPRSVVVHTKTNTAYWVISTDCFLEEGAIPAVAYAKIDPSAKNSLEQPLNLDFTGAASALIWVRKKEEMNDGRFMTIVHAETIDLNAPT